VDRRELLGLAGAAAPLLAGLSPSELHAVSLRARSRAAAPRSDVFDARQRAIVDQFAELIMPATDTPGARAAGVIGFIEVIVGEYYRDEERAAFMRGIADADARSQSLFQKTFMECAEAQQTAVLTGMEAESRAMPRGSPQHFWSRIKGLAIYGYYQSEVGSREELRFEFMPGRYDGNAPLPVRPAQPAGGR